MLIRILPPHALRESDVTPEPMYLDRRRFLAGMGIGVAALSLPLTACGANDKPAPLTACGANDKPAPLATLKLAKRSEQAGGEKLTEFETVSTYNKHYEIGTDKRSEERSVGKEGYSTSKN